METLWHILHNTLQAHTHAPELVFALTETREISVTNCQEIGTKSSLRVTVG